MRRLAFLALVPLVGLAAEPKTVLLRVQNMSCELCPLAVKKALARLPGVSAVQVEFASRTAKVTYDPDELEPEALVEATRKAGYPSTLEGGSP